MEAIQSALIGLSHVRSFLELPNFVKWKQCIHFVFYLTARNAAIWRVWNKRKSFFRNASKTTASVGPLSSISLLKKNSQNFVICILKGSRKHN